MATYPLAPQRVATTARAKMATKGWRRPRAWRGSSISANTSINGRQVSLMVLPLLPVDPAVIGEVYPTPRLSNSPVLRGLRACASAHRFGALEGGSTCQAEGLATAFSPCHLSTDRGCRLRLSGWARTAS